MISKRQPNLRKKALNAHAWSGLIFAALIYFISLTGTLLMPMEELERWELPTISPQPSLSERALDAVMAAYTKTTDSVQNNIYIMQGSPSLPRPHLSDLQQEWLVNSDGSLGERIHLPWLETLKAMHTHLHMPENLGMILVAIIGLMLLSLSISGIIAHAAIFKDAFKWRRSRSVQLKQVDTHNRLGVWGLPFYLCMAFTGVFMALSNFYIATNAHTFYGGDTGHSIAVIYGGEPSAPQTSDQTLDLKAALSNLKSVESRAQPIYFAVNNFNTPKQLIEIAAFVPKRLIYSEIYRFTSSGQYINQQGFKSGPVGRQLSYSTYRLHIGDFDGYWPKIIYFFLGLALCILCASGVNIWLAKRPNSDYLRASWQVTVWGLPLSLICSAIASLVGLTPLIVFLSTALFLYCMFSLIPRFRASRIPLILQIATSLALGILIIAHLAVYGLQPRDPMAGWVNLSLLVIALFLATKNYKQLRKKR